LKNWLDDDCEIIETEIGNDELLLATVDTSTEGVDFPADAPDFCIGYFSASLGLSDISACGGIPIGILVSCTVPGSYEKRLKGIYGGIKRVASDAGTYILGGDTNSSDEFGLSVVALGKVEKKAVLRRKGARPGDVLGVTGTLDKFNGGYFEYMEKGTCNFNEMFVQKPCTEQGRILASLGATSCIDLPDGLLKAMRDNMGNCGFLLHDEKIPVMSEKEKYKAATCPAGDIELMFTIPENKKNAVDDEFNRKGLDVYWIGRTIPERKIYIYSRRRMIMPEGAGFVHKFHGRKLFERVDSCPKTY
jgi:thiamine-monophosphate kinase